MHALLFFSPISLSCVLVINKYKKMIFFFMLSKLLLGLWERPKKKLKAELTLEWLYFYYYELCHNLSILLFKGFPVFGLDFFLVPKYPYTLTKLEDNQVNLYFLLLNNPLQNNFTSIKPLLIQIYYNHSY